MKTELQRKLLDTYPQLFQTKQKIYIGEKPMKEEIQELLNQKEIVSPIQFGFECGDGWFMLLDELMGNIVNHLENKNKFNLREGKQELTINITQIKEKFGGLRFYYNGGDDYIDGMVRMAESLSYKICEYCGTTKNIGYTKGWITTICKDCWQSNSQTNNMKWEPVNENE